MTTTMHEFIIDSTNKQVFGEFAQNNFRYAWQYRWAVKKFIANNLRRRYRRSILGFLWGLVGPFMTMSIMAAVFSLVFHADPHKYTVYVFSGLLPWSFIFESAVQGSQCFLHAETYLKKLYIPKVFFPLVCTGTDATNFLLSLLALMALGCVVCIQFKASVLVLPLVIAILAAYNFGMVMLYGVLTVYFRDLPHILQVIYPGLFYLLPVIYPLEVIPPQYRVFFLFNPFYWLINLFRRVIYDGVLPTAQEWLIPSAIAAGALCAGLIALRMKERDLIYRL